MKVRNVFFASAVLLLLSIVVSLTCTVVMLLGNKQHYELLIVS